MPPGGSHSSSLTRASVRQLQVLRLLRAAALGVGLCVGLLVEMSQHQVQLDARLWTGVALFLVSTPATFVRVFPTLSTKAMSAIAVMDMGTLLLVFDLRAGLEVVDALIAIPAMWLGLVLGRRGVALSVLLCLAFFALPGLALGGGSPLGGWPHVTAVTVLALVASAGIAASAEMWDSQLVEVEEKGRQLEQASRVKDDFIALVSHELRTPLTSIIGYNDLAMDEVDTSQGPLPAFLSAIARNAERMLALVTALLSAEAAEREPIRLNSTLVDVSTVVARSFKEFAVRAHARGLTSSSEIESGILAAADDVRFREVVENLLSNALKFTLPGGHVTVSLRRQSGRALLDVTDTGIGISAADQVGLFTKFHRGSNATLLAIQGVGLGLMITKAIVESHGGSIAFQSQEGAGTSFQVEFPLDTSSSKVPKPDFPGTYEASDDVAHVS